MQNDLAHAYPSTKIGEVNQTEIDVAPTPVQPSQGSHGHSHGGRACHGHGGPPIKFPVYRFHLPCGECEWDTEVFAQIIRKYRLLIWIGVLAFLIYIYWWLFF